jgi:hypothetical protein
MPPNALLLLRITIAIQVIVAAWFTFSPDLLPDLIREAEMQNDQPLYEALDNIIVPLVHVQTILCIALWWPTRIAGWGYALATAAIAVLASFAGPAILSAIDAFLGYIQVLASGAMLCLLYLHKLFAISQAGVRANA